MNGNLRSLARSVVVYFLLSLLSRSAFLSLSLPLLPAEAFLHSIRRSYLSVLISFSSSFLFSLTCCVCSREGMTHVDESKMKMRSFSALSHTESQKYGAFLSVSFLCGHWRMTLHIASILVCAFLCMNKDNLERWQVKKHKRGHRIIIELNKNVLSGGLEHVLALSCAVSLWLSFSREAEKRLNGKKCQRTRPTMCIRLFTYYLSIDTHTSFIDSNIWQWLVLISTTISAIERRYLLSSSLNVDCNKRVKRFTPKWDERSCCFPFSQWTSMMRHDQPKRIGFIFLLPARSLSFAQFRRDQKETWPRWTLILIKHFFSTRTALFTCQPNNACPCPLVELSTMTSFVNQPKSDERIKL